MIEGPAGGRSASVSVFAERTPISIADHDEELTVKRQAMSYMRPELALLGDYHSHPWRTREEVERGTLFEYSQDDARFWRKADPYWTCTDYRPLFLVMTVCRLQRVHDSRPRPLRSNVLQFDVGEFRFWLNAIVGRMDGKKRVLSPNVRSSVYIDELPLSLGGVSGGRLHDYDPAA